MAEKPSIIVAARQSATPASCMIRPDGLPTPVVLDTNVVLDWKVFAAPQASALRSALDSGQLEPVASPDTLAELRIVLERPIGVRWESERERTLSDWASLAGEFTLRSEPIPKRQDLHCSDPSDQKFLELALHAGVRWLLTRDKALLRLHRRTQALGLAIVQPERWTPPDAAVAPT